MNIKNEDKSIKSFLRRFWWLVLIIILLILGAFAIRGILHNKQLENEKKGDKKNTIYEQKVVKPKTIALISLPFSTEDASDSLAPMGETIFHSNTPGNIGHSGIDFQWHSNKTVRIIASMDAEIMSISINPLGSHDIITERDGWSIEYDGMALVNTKLKVGQTIKIGDYVGQPLPEKAPATGQGIHWQFGYYDKRQNRAYPAVCPLIYFDKDSLSLIENIWASVIWTEMKANAPDICSNYYKDRNSY